MERARPTSILPPPDGRQSEAARAIARGVRRMFGAAGLATLDEVALPNGRRADLMTLSPDGSIQIVEIKSCVADFRADRKWPDYRDYCDALYFAVDLSTPLDILPADAGLIVADAYGASLARAAPEHRLQAATRRSMLLRFARLAAGRLYGLHDPDWGGFMD